MRVLATSMVGAIAVAAMAGGCATFPRAERTPVVSNDQRANVIIHVTGLA